MARLLIFFSFIIASCVAWAAPDSGNDAPNGAATYELTVDAPMNINGYEINVGKGTVVLVQSFDDDGTALCEVGRKSGKIQSEYLVPSERPYPYTYQFLDDPSWGAFFGLLCIFLIYVGPFAFTFAWFRVNYIDRLLRHRLWSRWMCTTANLSFILGAAAFCYAYTKVTGRTVFEDLTAYMYHFDNRWAMLASYLAGVWLINAVLFRIFLRVKVGSTWLAFSICVFGLFMGYTGYTEFCGIFPTWANAVVAPIVALCSFVFGFKLVSKVRKCPLCYNSKYIEYQYNDECGTEQAVNAPFKVMRHKWECSKCGAQWHTYEKE